jgi:hypothetical protein
MAEALGTQAKEGLMEIKSPVRFVVAGLIFLILVIIVEAYKPGAITGPVKSFLGMFGLKTS